MGERALQSLVQEISIFNSIHNDEMLLQARGREVGYDLKQTRISIVIDFNQFNHMPNENHQQLVEMRSPELHKD